MRLLIIIFVCILVPLLFWIFIKREANKSTVEQGVSMSKKNAESEVSPQSVKVKLPLPEEMEKISIEPGLYKVFTVESLLKSLQEFKPHTETYATKQPFQRGKFSLKNGDVINWLSNSSNSILLIYKDKEQLFIIPNDEK